MTANTIEISLRCHGDNISSETAMEEIDEPFREWRALIEAMKML